MRVSLNIALMVLFGICLNSCSKSDFPATLSDDQLPVIQSLAPNSGAFGTSVTIRGDRFGALAERLTVVFNEVKAEIISINENEIEVVVPKRAKTGPVAIEVGNQKIEGPIFDYLLTVTVSTEAGSGIEGFINTTTQEARFNEPWGIEVDESGSALVSDYQNTAIRKITRDQTVTTFASEFTSRPMGLALGVNGTIYVAGGFNNLIQTVSREGKISRFAGTGFTGGSDRERLEATFNVPADVAIKRTDLTLYVADAFNNKIRVVHPDGNVYTLAGSRFRGYRNGSGQEALFYRPVGVALNTEETELYIADLLNHRIRKIDLINGLVSNFAGNGEAGFKDGPVAEASFNEPFGITIDKHGTVYVADSGNNRIRMIKNDEVSTIAGTGMAGFKDGTGSEAQFNDPYHLVINRNGGSIIYVADRKNNRIRRIKIE